MRCGGWGGRGRCHWGRIRGGGILSSWGRMCWIRRGGGFFLVWRFLGGKGALWRGGGGVGEVWVGGGGGRVGGCGGVWGWVWVGVGGGGWGGGWGGVVEWWGGGVGVCLGGVRDTAGDDAAFGGGDTESVVYGGCALSSFDG